MYYLRSLILLLLLLVSSANLSFADKVTIYNLDFAYSIESQIDSEQKEIKIGDYSKIIKISNLHDFIVEHYFFHTNTEYSFAELRDFLKASVTDNRPSLVAYIIKKATLQRDWTFAQASEMFSLLTPEFIAQIAKKDQFELDYQLSKRTNVGKYFLLIATEHYSDSFLRNCCSKPFNLLPSVAFYLRQKLSLGNSPVEIINDFYRKKSEILSNEDLKTIEKILSYLQVMGQLNSSFPKTYETIKKEYPSYFSELKEFFLVLRQQALDQAIKLKNFQLAFDLLLLQDVKERTEDTHKLVKDLLQELDLGFAPLLIIDPYKSYLKTIAEKDYQVKEAVIAALEKVVKGLVDSGKVFESKEYLPEIFLYRENPNSENTKLVFLLIKELDRGGLRDQIYLLRDTYELNYSVGQKFWFFKRGYYFSLLFIWAFLAIIIAFFILVYFKIIKIDKYQIFLKKLLKDLISIKPVITKGPANQFNHQFDQLNSDRQKFKSMLKYFEMTEKSTLEQIKSNYRKKIKAYHPDLNPNQSEIDKARFLEITERYEELLGLYSRFGPK